MKKKPKQKKKVVVDERGIERIGDKPIEYVYPAEKNILNKPAPKPSRTGP